MNSGVPVLIMLGGVGPIAGVFHREWREVEEIMIDPYTVEVRPGMEGAWRVEIDEVPTRFGRQVARLAAQLAPPADVRIWPEPKAEHYVGWAYVQAGDIPFDDRPRSYRVLGQGQLDRARR